jgi:hypothetical protein
MDWGKACYSDLEPGSSAKVEDMIVCNGARVEGRTSHIEFAGNSSFGEHAHLQKP